MAAGQGFKTFVTGEVLTSGDVNGYLMQGINVFTNATARDAAITAPAEGQFAFTKDNNSLWYYDGAAWVSSGATGDIEGVTAGVGISGGGTSGTVTVTNSMATAIDAKGDLVPGTGADTFTRLAVGANDTVLTADSSTATGLKWAAPSGGGGGKSYTLLNTGGTSLSGGSTTVSGISNQDKLIVIVQNATMAVALSNVGFQFNGANTNEYDSIEQGLGINGTYAAASFVTYSNFNNNMILVGNTSNTTSSQASASISIDSCNSTGTKAFDALGGALATGSNSQNLTTSKGIFRASAAITSVTVRALGTTFTGGTIFVYGSAV